jgi:hypothetical protein
MPIAMKNRVSRLLVVIATVFTFGYARAAEPIRVSDNRTAVNLERALDRALNRHLAFPIMEKGDMTGKVQVSFNIDKEGKVQVLSCTSENERLRAYVLRKLARIEVGANPEGIWKTTHMIIDFHPERQS